MGEDPTQALVQQLHDRRVNLVEQMRELHAKAEAMSNRQFHSAQPSLKAEWEELDSEQHGLGERIDQLLTAAESEKDLDSQRSRFNHALGGSNMNENRTEFLAWARGQTGDLVHEVDLSQLERHDLTTGGASAGDMVPLGFVGKFYQHLLATAGVRRTNAQVYTTADGSPMVLPKSVTDSTAAIIAEGGAITANDPAFADATLGAFGYKSMVFVSKELVQDSAVDIEGILARLLGRAIGTANGAHLVTGTGSGQPAGVALTPVDGSVSTWAILVAGATGPDLLTDLYHSINAPYRANATWMMNDATLAALRKLKSTTNEYLVQSNLTISPTEQIFGRPVITDPTFATGAGTGTRILFGNFEEYYAIRDVAGLRLDRSDDYRFANDEVAFRAVLRTDAKQVLNDAANAAVKALRITA